MFLRLIAKVSGTNKRQLGRCLSERTVCAPRAMRIEQLEARLVLSFTPAQVAQAYGFDNIFFPSAQGNFIKGDGTGQTIAIVVPYRQPNLVSDLHTFSQRYGLPDAQITICNQYGSTNPSSLPQLATGNWGLEATLDVEWAHAMAPGANILVVETVFASNSNLLAGANTARNAGIGSLSHLPNVSVVSMSWGGYDISGDMVGAPFSTPAGKAGVAFVAATGDTGATGQYPAGDPNVLAVGGTTLSLNAQGNYGSETGWSSSNGGFGANPAGPYQQGLQPFGSQNNGMRMTPDVAFDAGAYVNIYDSYDGGGWTSVAGTSLGAPCWAALIAIANQGLALGQGNPLSGNQVLADLYNLYGNGNYQYAFHDITSGHNAGYTAGTGYDLVTGLGTPRANVIAAALAGTSQTPTPLTPGGIITAATPSFQWTAIGGATGYYLTIVDTTTGVTVANALSVLGTSYSLGTPLTVGHSFQWKVQAYDQSGALAAASSPLAFNLAAVDHVPAGSDNSVSALEDTPYTFASADFGFSDPDDTPSNQLLAVKITSLPAAGTLVNNSAAVVAGQFISAGDIASGNLKFVPGANGNGAGYASFTFQVQDDGDITAGGANLDPTANTLTIDVTPVNDPPTGADNSATMLDYASYTFSAADFGFSDLEDLPANSFLAVKIKNLPTAGALTINGAAVVAGQLISIADITAGLLAFTPAEGASGAPYASFTFQVQDSGGTSNGGVDLDPVPKTFVINVTAVNIAPTGVSIVGPTTALRGEVQTYTLSANDAPADIGAGIYFTVDWGDGSPLETVGAHSTRQVTHAFDAAGSLSATVTATDQWGATSAAALLGVHVDAVQLRPDLDNPALVDLVWGGTSGVDEVRFDQITPTTIRIRESTIDGAAVSNSQDFTGITGRVIAGGSLGNDLLDTRGLVTAQATLDGGGGNNTLYGGSGGDILIGGSNGGEGKQGNNVIIAGNGDNTIYGNALTARKGASGGNNLIVGGTGHDTIYGSFGTNPSGNGGEGGASLIVGGGGGDVIYASQQTDGAEGGHGSIMVAGTTSLGQTALLSILSEWSASRSYEGRVANISGTSTALRNNGDNFLQPGVNVFNDNVFDQLYSDSFGSPNWILFTVDQDSVCRTKSGEIETNLP